MKSCVVLLLWEEEEEKPRPVTGSEPVAAEEEGERTTRGFGSAPLPLSFALPLLLEDEEEEEESAWSRCRKRRTVPSARPSARCARLWVGAASVLTGCGRAPEEEGILAVRRRRGGVAGASRWGGVRSQTLRSGCRAASSSYEARVGWVREGRVG